MPLPNFIIIGAMKSGTSTLHSNLQLHPEIGMSKLKEPHYFDKFFDKPLSYYSDQFPQEKRLNGESTPAYTWNHIFPEVPKRIFNTVPNVKLVYLLRDPIDRIISHLHHDLYRGRVKYKDVDKVVLENSNYVQISSYYTQLGHYLEYFDLEKIYILETYSLQKDTNRTLNEICQFLGAEEFDFTDLIKARNQSSRKYLIRYYDTVHKYLPRHMSRLYHLMFYVVNEKIARPILKKETLRELKWRLYPDIKKLKKISGKGFTDWKTYNSIDLESEFYINSLIRSRKIKAE